MFGFKKSIALPTAAQALPGRAQAIRTAAEHFVNHNALKGPYPEARKRRCSASAVSGAPSANSGSWVTASMSPPSAMPAA